MASVRRAQAADHRAAVELLMLAAGRLLTDIFGHGDATIARRFLARAWQQGDGQYGFRNHWVAHVDGQVTGMVTSWHDQLPAQFDRHTLDQITEHFGLDATLDIVMRSQAYSSALHPPAQSQLAIGHLAVATGYQRQGIGRLLLHEMTLLAQHLGKSSLVLDVEAGNTGAINFYHALGFVNGQSLPPFQQMVKAI